MRAGGKKETESEHKREIQREDGLDAIIQKVTYKNMLSLDNSRKLADGRCCRNAWSC